jgi:hypothetical protein
MPRLSRRVRCDHTMWRALAYLFAMLVALDDDEAVVTGSHASERVLDKVRFWVVIAPRQDVGDGDGVGGHEPAATDEATIDNRKHGA